MKTSRSRVQPFFVLPVFALVSGALIGQAVSTREAAQAEIAQHVKEGRIGQALTVYDAFVAAAKRSDVGLLDPIARGELRDAAKRFAQDAVLRAAALERLARAGDAEALQTLRQSAGASHPAAALSLARLSEKEAPARLGALLAGADGRAKLEILRAIADADARSEAPKVAALLDDPDPQVRIAAARAVGILGYREAIPRLSTLAERDPTVVRHFAAVALKRLGDPSADAAVAKMLASEVPELRLMAAAAYPQTPRAPWVERIKALRSDPNELTRLRVAETLACCDPDTARAVLAVALSHDDPSMRVEAARVLDEQRLADARIARRLLGDSFPQVRLYGAGAALKLAAASR